MEWVLNIRRYYPEETSKQGVILCGHQLTDFTSTKKVRALWFGTHSKTPNCKFMICHCTITCHARLCVLGIWHSLSDILENLTLTLNFMFLIPSRYLSDPTLVPTELKKRYFLSIFWRMICCWLYIPRVYTDGLCCFLQTRGGFLERLHRSPPQSLASALGSCNPI